MRNLEELPMLIDPFLAGLKERVAQSTGLVVRPRDDAKLRGAIVQRMAALQLRQPADYYRLLTKDEPGAYSELIKLAALLVNLESYFFRDQAQHSFLQRKILPWLIQRKKNSRTIKVWSAGCAAGEEPYSIAIILALLPINRAEWHLNVVGTDLSAEAIACAQEGRYHEYAFRRCPPALKERFFLREAAQWVVRPAVKQQVQFYQHNLIKEPFIPQVAGADIILCRNVMIYLEKEAVRRLIGQFYEALPVGGILLTGPGELYLNQSHPFRQVVAGEALFYQKGAEMVC